MLINALMSLERLDLNLLRVFQAIDAERSVTRAAVRLGLTQSAASNALARLRAAFADELFQRAPGRHGADGTRPRARRAHRRRTRRGAEAVELNRPFDPSERARRVHDRRLGLCRVRPRPDLVASLQARAPGVSVVFRHADRDGALDLLDEDRAHLALGMFPEPPARMTRIVLMRDRFVVLMRPGHPAAAGPDLDAYLAVPHLLVSAGGEQGGRGRPRPRPLGP